MPKERRDRSVSFDRSRASPFPCGSSRSLLSLTKNPSDNEENVKEWEVTQCPVCMEHPHNAILLICSSHDKGCRPFMCDTSYRHSNCFDQFRKSSAERSETVQQEGAPVSVEQPSSNVAVPEAAVTSSQAEARREGSPGMHDNVENQKGKLVCPLCRGDVNGWMVDEPARIFMNSKSRSCASETCDFSGTYAELRKHARVVHPEVRPTEADPERQRDWRRLEQQRDFGDLISTLQSSIGEEMESTEDGTFTFNESRWLTVYFLIRVFRPRRSSRSSSWSGSSRARAPVRRPTTRLWGESYDSESRDRDRESRDRDTETRDPDTETRDGGTGLRWSEQIRRQPTQRQQTPDDES
ncbi:hypothetical protein ACET3Z_009366 [Daucus carota]